MKTSHPFSNASWDDVRLFLAALEHGSFTDAAKALHLGQATMSRRIAELERVVGHVLFDRSRGGLQATHAAQRLRPWAEAMGASMRDAAATLAGLEAAPEGRVRLTCAPGMAVEYGPKLIKRLRAKYPKLVVELLADVRVRDLAAHEADLALRSSVPASGPLVARKLVEMDAHLYGSRELVRRLPARPRLDQVPVIAWSDELPSLAQAMAHLPCPRAMITNDYLAMCAAAEAGIGAMICTTGQAHARHLERVEVALPPFPRFPVYLVVHEALRTVPRVKAVLEVIDELWREEALALDVSRSPSARRKATSPSPP